MPAPCPVVTRFSRTRATFAAYSPYVTMYGRTFSSTTAIAAPVSDQRVTSGICHG